jgi:hypothetical protein
MQRTSTTRAAPIPPLRMRLALSTMTGCSLNLMQQVAEPVDSATWRL